MNIITWRLQNLSWICTSKKQTSFFECLNFNITKIFLKLPDLLDFCKKELKKFIMFLIKLEMCYKIHKFLGTP